MALFNKIIKVWVNTCDKEIFIKLSINGIQISRIQSVLYPEGTLLIGDILPFIKKRHYCKGYGSLMMNKLLEYAATIGVHTIRGKLSSVDSGHKERLHAFYKKHGFDIIEYNTPQGLFYGEVKKII
ncbi:MAG: hypothetical protein PHV32_10620 [Eubacteriales bacterium]|nr:hypothetical protein [Eubacteriales bacterium]